MLTVNQRGATDKGARGGGGERWGGEGEGGGRQPAARSCRRTSAGPHGLTTAPRGREEGHRYPHGGTAVQNYHGVT